MKKDVKFVWSPAQQDAFEKLKSLVTSAPIFTLPNKVLDVLVIGILAC